MIDMWRKILLFISLTVAILFLIAFIYTSQQKIIEKLTLQNKMLKAKIKMQPVQSVAKVAKSLQNFYLPIGQNQYVNTKHFGLACKTLDIYKKYLDKVSHMDYGSYKTVKILDTRLMKNSLYKTDCIKINPGELGYTGLEILIHDSDFYYRTLLNKSGKLYWIDWYDLDKTKKEFPIYMNEFGN